MTQLTQDEFLERHRHELAGLILDAATAGRTGADLALWLRTVMRKIDTRLVAIYQDAYPPKPLPVNGNGLAPVRKL